MKILDWGTIEYTQATRQQLELVEAVSRLSDPIIGGDGSAKNGEYLVFCSHEPVVTIGRGTQPGDVFGWQGPTLETSRGGRATYHGPNQIVAYPILNLNFSRASASPRDLHAYLRALETAIVSTLSEYGIQSEARTIKMPDEPSLTGVWVGERKIASLGIAVKKWVTYHGLALNVDYDPQAFSGINPCGFSSSIMTSMEQELDRKVNREDVQATLEAALLNLLKKN